MLLKSIRALMAPQTKRAAYLVYYALGTVVGMGCCWYIFGWPEEASWSNPEQEQLLSVDSVHSSFSLPLPKAIDIPIKESADTSFALQ
ncbi:hypothetical protein QWY31_06000 [Cytophagales bacterium LB-30]|uniref:Uncharacterized protein n=1 Tax=Shiella aurantiaca TaxID=3058365 RepID=A0ABT8F3K9_9BACT|nr:hypothetical protein [Shiella aurantiaca]MDN4165046.1 hypothetical protein [Shiella aurantiaca]